MSKNRFEFCWITVFPMYEWDEKAHRINFCHKPFSMPQGGLEALEAAITTEQRLALNAYQYDIVCNGIELSSGAIRNHDLQIMYKAFEIAGYGPADLQEKFGGLLRALQFGAPPHGGIAPGIDRMVMLLAGAANLRDVVMFPMNQQSEDLMMGAPENADLNGPRTVGRCRRPTPYGRVRTASAPGVPRNGDKRAPGNCRLLSPTPTATPMSPRIGSS